MAQNSTGYICKYCGHTSRAAAAGSCSDSPHKKHEYIGQHPGKYACQYCGHQSTAANSGSCAKSPFKKHEYM